MGRVVRLLGDIDEKTVLEVWEKILKLWDKDRKNDIVLQICSTGGSPSAGTAFYDLVKSHGISLVTVAMGEVSSSAIPVFCAGKSRKCLSHTLFIIHGISHRFENPRSFDYRDTSLMAQELEILNHYLADILKTAEVQEKVWQKVWVGEVVILDSEKALEMGLVSEIISPP